MGGRDLTTKPSADTKMQVDVKQHVINMDPVFVNKQMYENEHELHQ